MNKNKTLQEFLKIGARISSGEFRLPDYLLESVNELSQSCVDAGGKVGEIKINPVRNGVTWNRLS